MFATIKVALLIASLFSASALSGYVTYTYTKAKLEAKLNQCQTELSSCSGSVNMLTSKLSDTYRMIEEMNNTCAKRVEIYKRMAKKVSNAKSCNTDNNSNCDDTCRLLNEMFK